ncbi:MAG: S41 family peptidase [Litorimonas sp.]
MKRSLTAGLAALLLVACAPSPSEVAPAPATSESPMGAEGETALADARFMLDLLAENYAGWPTKTSGPLANAIRDAEATMLREARAAETPTDHFHALFDYVETFGDGHMGLSNKIALEARDRPLPGTPTPEDLAQVPPLDDGTVSELVIGNPPHPVEGLWSIGGDRYVLRVSRHASDPGLFDAVVENTTADGWSEGDLKARFRAMPDGGLIGRYRAGDRSESGVHAELKAEGALLELTRWGYWQRVGDRAPDPQMMRRIVPDGLVALETLPDATPWFRLPNFAVESGQVIARLVEENRALLEGADRLVLDLRGNGGGSDSSYAPLLPFVVDDSFETVGAEILVTDRNLAAFEANATELEPDNPELAATIRAIVADIDARVDGRRGVFAPMYAETSTLTNVVPAPGARRVAVLIDGAGSSGEQFILDVKDAPNVTLFGHDNSAGVLDFSNMISTPLPSGRFDLRWATSRSLRLPENGIDDGGIAPDVRFGDEVDDPVMAANDWLKANP